MGSTAGNMNSMKKLGMKWKIDSIGSGQGTIVDTVMNLCVP
jgi:hypothetical protein